MDSFGEKFGQLVRAKRLRNEMSMADLSDRIFGAPSQRAFISKLENGRVRHPSTSTISKFSRALGITDLELDEISFRSSLASSNVEKPAKVFLSYCREDVDSARLVYSELASSGFDVWVDFAKLDGGQRWKSAVSEAIKSADFFVALLSENAINKRGYVQKEIREALDVLQTVPEDQSFFLPCRLEECQPKNQELEELHWVDLFPNFEAGIKSLIRGIKNQYVTAFSSTSMKMEKKRQEASHGGVLKRKVRVNFSLTEKQSEALRRLQEEVGAESSSEVLRRALALLEVVEKERQRGSEVVLDRIEDRIKLILPS